MVQHCPACDQKISDHAVLCVYCGYHLETGKFVKGMGGRAAAAQKAEGHEGAALMLLKKAERAINQDKDEERKMRTQGMPLWMIITILSIIASFTVGMSVLPRDQAFQVSGYVWMSVCGSLAIVYWFRLVVIAFKESTTHGLMFQFVPFYALYYVVKRWADCGKLFMTHVILSLLVSRRLDARPPWAKAQSGADARGYPGWPSSARGDVVAPLDPSTSIPVASMPKT